MLGEFQSAVASSVPDALRADSIDIVQVNIGLRCNMACTHCHQSCSPSRTEIMSAETMAHVVRIVDGHRPSLVDITGGAPELHPDLRSFVTDLHRTGVPIQLRSNLTALLEPEAAGLIEFLAAREVRILASLPSLHAEEYRVQRPGPLDSALAGLKALSSAGYGASDERRLDIAVNTDLAGAPADPEALCKQFRTELTGRMGIEFSDLVVISNVPVGRFRDRLAGEGRLDAYLDELKSAFNPETLRHLSCRSTLEIAWDGTLSDCDFNLGRGMRTAPGVPGTVAEFDAERLARRAIRFADHCYACAAASGSG